MVEEEYTASEVKETDIVFDCPQCGKSLAIDYRGAGLTIPCTDCGSHVEVPIPEGMELTDIDSSDEEQEMQILNLRRSLAVSEIRVGELERELRDVSERRETLETEQSRTRTCVAEIREQAKVMQAALRQMSDALQSIIDAAR